MSTVRERISVAKGEKDADLVLKNGQLINVFSGEIYHADVAISKDRIAGIGDYQGKEEIDLNGRYLVPGFIDSHSHIESTMLLPAELSRVLVPNGTTAIIADPHEIANVLGLAGIEYLLNETQNLPLDVFFTVPSCVPAIELETSGAKIGNKDVINLLKRDRVLKLGEMTNFTGVISKKKSVLDEVVATYEMTGGIEGHAPGLRGKELEAYVAVGVSSDHETTSLDEAKEKLKAGLQILIREGSSAKNLEAIVPLITPQNSRFFCFCTDDIYPQDLAEGHLNLVLKKAVANNLPPVTAVQMVTINPARYYNLKGYGAIAPGYFADINILSNLEDFSVDMVFKKGKKVAAKKKLDLELKKKKNKKVRQTIKVKPFEIDSLALPAKSDYAKAIGIVPGKIETKSIVVKVKKKKGMVVSDIDSDVLKAVVIERHKASGKIGQGLVKGFGLKQGAIASSVSHDVHNIVSVGIDDEDLISAVRRVIDLGGGMVVVRGGLVLAELPLPIAGLISDQPLQVILEKLAKLEKAVGQIGSELKNIFGLLSFISLPVMPELRLTDEGLVDVAKAKVVSLFE